MKLIAFLCMALAATTSAPSVDLTDPKTAAVAFTDAMNAGDADTVKSTSMGTDDLVSAATSLADNVKAEKRLSDAARDKFGDDAAKIVAKPNYKPFFFPFDKPTLRIENDGESAKLTVDNHPKPFLTLRNTGSKWQVELSSIPFLAKDPGALIEVESRSAKVKTDLAEEIEIGKYASAEDAHRAFVEMLVKAEGKK